MKVPNSCPDCGASLDWGERCDCRAVAQQPQQADAEPTELAGRLKEIRAEADREARTVTIINPAESLSLCY